MTLLSALSSSITGLQVTSTQIQVASDNISNANTAGYTEKNAVLKSVAYGNGSSSVHVSGYSRAADNTTYTALLASTSQSSNLSTTGDYLSQVESILGSADTSTSTSLTELYTNFQNAWTSLAAEPESATQKQSVISAGKALAAGIQSTASSVESLNRTVTEDVSTTISTLNSDLQQIAQYNNQIATANATGQQSGDLQDKRDQLVLDVSKIAKVTVMQRDNGSMALYTTAGYQLVDGSQAQTFTYDGIDVTNTNNSSLSLNNTLVGGSLESQLSFIDTSTAATESSDDGSGVIGKLRSMLNSFAASLSTTGSTPASFEDAYSSGTSLGTFFTATAGSESSSIAVSPGLVDGTTTLDTTSISAVTSALSDSTRTFTSSCLSLSNASYSGWATQILSYYQQASSNVASLSKSATSETSYLTTEYSNNTGVSTDDELIKLTALQNAYNASAKVISTVNSMLSTLMDAV